MTDLNKDFYKLVCDYGREYWIAKQDRMVMSWMLQHTPWHIGNLRYLKKLFSKLDRKGTFVDIGMSIGMSTIEYSTFDSASKIVAFEPSPTAYELALRNIKLNRKISSKKGGDWAFKRYQLKMKRTAIKTHNIALGKKKGLIEFVDTPQLGLGHVLMPDEELKKRERVTKVPV